MTSGDWRRHRVVGLEDPGSENTTSKQQRHWRRGSFMTHGRSALFDLQSIAVFYDSNDINCRRYSHWH